MPAETVFEDEGIVRPMRRRNDPSVGPDALLVMTPGDLRHLLKVNESQGIESFDMSFFKLHCIRQEGTGPLSLAGPFLGAPQAVMGMEKLIALGAERLWTLGWCGSIQSHLRVGDMVIPTDSVSEEGTSRLYPITSGAPSTDEELNKRLIEALRQRGQRFCTGTIWTTDAPYRETPRKVRAYQQEGVLAVEMEMAALITLAAYRSVRIAGLLVVSDELFDLQWRPGFRDERFAEATRVAGEIVTGMLRAAKGGRAESPKTG